MSRKRKRRQTGTPLLLALILCVTAVGLFWATTKLSAAPDSTGILSQAVEASMPTSGKPMEVPSKPAPPPPATVRFVAAGDNLIHDNIYQQAAARTKNNGYDFAPVYEHIRRLVQGADLAFVNQETIIAESLFPLAGYPLFNSPEAVGDYLTEGVGFNVINIANNHMFDMREQGLNAALDFWAKKKDVLNIGVWRSEEDMKKPLLMKKNGITFGFVPITEHTNGLKLPQGTSLRFLRSDERELMKQQVELAKANADFVVVSIHWGTENSNDVNNNQLELAQLFADWGVDLVLGHHSHTLQPMEWRTGSSGKRTLVVYSMGNLVGSMLDPQNMLGGIVDLEITKDYGSGKTVITQAKLTPTVIQYDGKGRRDVRIYPYDEYTDELAAKHGMKAKFSYFGRSYLKEIIEKNIPSEFRSDLVL